MEDEKEERFLAIPTDNLLNYYESSLLIAVIGLIGVAVLPFIATATWFYLTWWGATVVAVLLAIRNGADFSKSALLTTYSYLAFSVPAKNGKKKRFFLLDDEHLVEAYKEYAGDDEAIAKENRELQAKHLMDSKIIDGMQKEKAHISGAYFICNKDHTFYYDENLQALLSFTSKDSAQEYVDQNVPDFDGYIMYMPIALDGEVKSIVKEDNDD